MIELQFDTTVTMLDGSEFSASKPSMADMVGFERQFSTTVSKVFTPPAPGMPLEWSLEHVLWMIWRSLHRTSVTELDFDAWVEQVDKLDIRSVNAGSVTPSLSDR